jgi:hypothetical protein
MTIGGTDEIDMARRGDHRRGQTLSDTLDLSGRSQSPAPRGFFVDGAILRPGTAAQPPCSFPFRELACTQISND